MIVALATIFITVLVIDFSRKSENNNILNRNIELVQASAYPEVVYCEGTGWCVIGSLPELLFFPNKAIEVNIPGPPIR